MALFGGKELELCRKGNNDHSLAVLRTSDGDRSPWGKPHFGIENIGLFPFDLHPHFCHISILSGQQEFHAASRVKGNEGRLGGAEDNGFLFQKAIRGETQKGLKLIAHIPQR